MNDHRPRSPLEVELDLDRVTQALEEAVGEYQQMMVDAAEAEANWREVDARSQVALADSGTRMTVAERDARAHVMALDEYRVHLLMEARAKSRREYLASLRTQVAALQTLAANRRQLG